MNLVLKIHILVGRFFEVIYRPHFKMGFPADVARSLVQLFEDGCEVPFIARYRRHLIGGATPDDLRYAVETFKNAKYVYRTSSSGDSGNIT